MPRYIFAVCISVLLDVHANLPKTSPYFVFPNGFGEGLFSNVRIVPGKEARVFIVCENLYRWI